MNKKLHIIAFNVPFPADYGGVIDVYYRIKALNEAGVQIHLHCFEYGREQSPELESLCAKVYYYHRPKTWIKQFSILPFIVKTRNSKCLINNLLHDNWPILFEGLHSCYFLNDKRLGKRLKIVRSHNIEHHYYSQLASKNSQILKKFYLKIEAFKLQRFENVYCHADKIGAISQSDFVYLHKKFGDIVFLLPPSHANNKVSCEPGMGKYILYHGNLEVKENEEAAMFILSKIAPYVNFSFIIAGKNPSNVLSLDVAKCQNVQLNANPSNSDMEELLAGAHINFLPTFQPTGFKLKLLNALFCGRFCVGTPELTQGTGLETLCFTAQEPADMITVLNELLTQTFSSETIEKRKALLENHSNSAVISSLLRFI